MAHKGTFRVIFIKSESDRNKREDIFLGSVEIDETGVNAGFSLMAKAFRQAPPKCLQANRVRVERA